MDFLRMLPVLVLAPFLFFGVGLPWAIACRQPAWAPLWGVAVMGFAAELACIAGVSVPVVVAAVGTVHLGAGMWLGLRTQSHHAAGVAFASFGQMYLLALIPFVVAPFATPGLWSMDWFLTLEGGLHVWQGTPFTPELLARPPFFGAAAIPLLLAGPLLPAFQAFCAVASACALQSFRMALPASAPPATVWVLAASLFFLQVSLNAWPKFLSAAFLLAAWEALLLAGRARPVLAGIFFGLALATHQAAVLFAPVLLVRFLDVPASGRVRLAGLGIVTALAALVVLPWETYTVAAYGWAAKVHANPVVAQRLLEIPAWLNAALVGLGTFVGWGPLHVLQHWWHLPDRMAFSRIFQESYWLVTSTFNSLAASLLGLVLPWWVALGVREFPRRLAAGWRQTGWPMRAALALALAGQMGLNPYYSTDGSMHTGWVPAGLALALWFAGELAAGPAFELGAVVRWTLVLGAFPWVVFQVALTAALVLSAKFRSVYLDTDLQLIEKHGWTTVALGGFPWVQGTAALVGVLAGRLPRRCLA
ncbi:MAG: hypothetical protein WDM96_09580 [Lacunisphaera sp.]